MSGTHMVLTVLDFVWTCCFGICSSCCFTFAGNVRRCPTPVIVGGAALILGLPVLLCKFRLVAPSSAGYLLAISQAVGLLALTVFYKWMLSRTGSPHTWQPLPPLLCCLVQFEMVMTCHTVVLELRFTAHLPSRAEKSLVNFDLVLRHILALVTSW